MRFICKYKYHIWNTKGFCVTSWGLQPLLEVLGITHEDLLFKIGKNHNNIVKFKFNGYSIFPEKYISNTKSIRYQIEGIRKTRHIK